MRSRASLVMERVSCFGAPATWKISSRVRVRPESSSVILAGPDRICARRDRVNRLLNAFRHGPGVGFREYRGMVARQVVFLQTAFGEVRPAAARIGQHSRAYLQIGGKEVNDPGGEWPQHILLADCQAGRNVRSKGGGPSGHLGARTFPSKPPLGEPAPH